MSTPKRIQRQRTKGWKMPADAVYVGRPTCWGNPYKVGKHGDAEACVRQYREAWEATIRSANMEPRHPLMPFGRPVYVGPLRGKDLACWCPLDQPCHADYLLKIVNG